MNYVPSIVDLFLTLFNNMAVLILVAYVFSRTELYENIIDKKYSLKNATSLIILMGLFSIYGTLSGVNVLGAVANIRNLGPIVAGLIGGPVIGFFTGLIGGVHRYFYKSNITCIPCSLATVIAGLSAGFLFRLNKKKFIGLKKAVIFAMIFELFHSLLVLIMSRPFEQALEIEKRTTLPRVFVVGIGMAVFAFILDNMVKERRIRKEKAKIESELKIATEIQSCMLPRIFPAFPEMKEFDIYAMMEPAKEVGGDFYDFFLADKNKLCFLIGDVTDKGIAAALFMVICKTLIKTQAIQNENTMPSEILYRVNNMLYPDNDACMFATVFCAILDIETGELVYANAGHNPPLLLRKNSETEFVKVHRDLPIGIMENSTYIPFKLTLQPQDSILLYTDGVPEAMNVDGAQFSEKRLEKILMNEKTKGVKELIIDIKNKVVKFAGEAPQSDDITMVALKYRGKEQ